DPHWLDAGSRARHRSGSSPPRWARTAAGRPRPEGECRGHRSHPQRLRRRLRCRIICRLRCRPVRCRRCGRPGRWPVGRSRCRRGRPDHAGSRDRPRQLHPAVPAAGRRHPGRDPQRRARPRAPAGERTGAGPAARPVTGDRRRARGLALSRRLRLSRPTVRQGIQELVDKGMLVRKRGVGTQVVQAPVNRQVALTSLYDDLRTAGKAPRTEVVEYRIGRPSPEAVDRLQLAAGEQVLDLIRVRYADDEPLAVMRNTIPERIAPTRAELAANGLYACLREAGITTVLAHERIGATVADEEHAELLDEELGAALLTMERKSFANDGS